MTTIVINECYGGFGLSPAAANRLTELGFADASPSGFRSIDRDSPLLIQTVRELGAASNGSYADLAVVEIPDDVKWHIHEYDGYETVHEDHRVWTSNGEDDSC